MEFKIGNFNGNMTDTHFWMCQGHSNDTPFKALGVNKLDYCKSILGYLPRDGDFPYCRNREDLFKLCNQLDKDLSAKLLLSKGSSKTSLSVGDYMKIGAHNGKLVQNFAGCFWDGPSAVFYQEGLKHKDRYDHQIDILGNSEKRGTFPYCETIEELVIFCAALDALVKKPDASEVNGYSFHIGDFVEITKSPYNWNTDMDIWNGKVVQITEILDQSTTTCKIRFINSGHWSWQFHSKHFKKVSPGWYESPVTKPFSPVEFNFQSPNIGTIKGMLKSDSVGSWYWNGVLRSNDIPFTECDFSPRKMQEEILGYSNTSGVFPYCRTYEDLLKFCEALAKKRELYFASQVSLSVRNDDEDEDDSDFDYSYDDDDEEEEKKPALVTPILIKVCKI